MFEIVFVCRTYDYTFDEKKITLFSYTVKDVAWCWFMSLPWGSITTWAQMQQTLNYKYKDYCRSKEEKEEIFRMSLGPYESLEDYEESFQLNYRRDNYILGP